MFKFHPFKKTLEEWFSEKISEKSLNFDIVLMCLIFISSFIYVSSSFPINEATKLFLKSIDFVIMIIFTIEVILRILISKEKFSHFLSIYTWIDILAVLPFWFGFSQSQILRLFRFFRIFRFFKFLRYSPESLKNSFSNENYYLEKLLVIRILITILIFVFISTALVYEFENQTNPKINTFFDSLYLILISVTTVGYGDIVHITFQAKLIIIFTVLSTLVIIPTQISTAFKFLATQSNSKDGLVCKNCNAPNHLLVSNYCYNCGKKLLLVRNKK